MTSTVPSYKLTLAPPDDSDPPTNATWTVDELIGINPPYAAINLLATPYNYGAVGDGVTDDTVAFQAFLDAIAGGAGYVNGTFGVSNTLYISGLTTLFGSGVGSACIQVLDSMPNTVMLINKNTASGTSPRIDTDISIYNIRFQGIPSAVVADDFVNFLGVVNLRIQGCDFRHRRKSLLVMGNCQDVWIVGNTFYDWGETTLGYGVAIFCVYPCFRVNICNNRLTGVGLGSGIWLPVINSLEPAPSPAAGVFFVVDGNIITGVTEAAIIGAPAGCVISNNVIFDVAQTDVSGHGMELHGSDFSILNNSIINVAQNGIDLSNSQRVIISGNNIAGINKINKDVAFHNSGILLRVFEAAAGEGIIPPRNVTITGNTIYSGGTGHHAIAFYSRTAGSDGYMDNILCEGNNCGTPADWVGVPIYVGDDAFEDDVANTSNFIRRGNLGDPDQDRSLVSVQIPSGAVSGATKHIGGVGFRPRAIDFQATLTTTSTTVSCGSIGQSMWTTGWSIAGQNITSARANFVSNCMAWSSDGTNAYTDMTGSGLCINVRNPDGTLVCAADVTAVDDDGFTLTIREGNSTASIDFNAICYP